MKFEQAISLARGTRIRVRAPVSGWGGEWVEATVDHVGGRGLSAIVGTHGCWYFRFEDVEVLR